MLNVKPCMIFSAVCLICFIKRLCDLIFHIGRKGGEALYQIALAYFLQYRTQNVRGRAVALSVSLVFDFVETLEQWQTKWTGLLRTTVKVTVYYLDVLLSWYARNKMFILTNVWRKFDKFWITSQKLNSLLFVLLVFSMALLHKIEKGNRVVLF